MAATESTMLELGTYAPSFRLKDPKGEFYNFSEIAEGKKAMVVAFICNHCPFVIHVAQVLSNIARAYENQEVGFVGINSNDMTRYPADSADKMRVFSKKYNFCFPYLIDNTQQLAKAYRAACTPDFFLFDSQTQLTYRGQMDDSRPGNNLPVTGKDLKAAIEATLQGSPPVDPQIPSIGCNIKWIPGSEPDYVL